MELSQRSEPSNNYGDGLSIAFELVATPALFGFLGFGLDHWLGFTPLFTIALTLISLATVIGLTIWRYDAEMHRADSARRERAAARPRRAARWERSRESQLGHTEVAS